MPRDRIRRQRDAGAPMRRFARMEDAKIDDDGVLRLIASTNAPVRFGSWREVLVHTEDAIDRKGAHSLLINHDPNQIAGTIRAMRVEGGKLEMEVVVDAEARLSSGVTVRNAVKSGSLRGVSIGYDYSREDYADDEDTRTRTVGRWRLLEATLTPIPADADAGVRSLPFNPSDHTRTNPMKNKIILVRLLALAAAFPHLAKSLNERAQVVDKDDDEAKAGERALAAWAQSQPEPTDAAGDEAKRAKEIADTRQRAERAELELKLRSVASAHGIDTKDLNFAGFTSEVEGLRALMERKAKDEQTAEPGMTVVRVTADQADKVRAAAIDGIVGNVFGKPVAGNPFAGRSLRSTALAYARKCGINTDDWDNKDAAHYALGQMRATDRLRSAANIGTGNFPNFVFLDAITKVVAKGYEMGVAGLVHPIIADINRVPDFKASKIGGMGTGNLQETAENTAFPELDKSEGVFSSSALMWGGTLSLSLQALINDDTGQFERSLRMAGAIAMKTKEKRAIQKFLRGTATTDASTWTNNTTNGCTPVYTTADTIAAARANMYRASVGMMNKVGLDGNPLATMPRYVLAGPTASLYLSGLLQNASGQAVANSGVLELLTTPFLELTTLTGNSTTSYYLLADKMLTTGLMETVITGFEVPQVQEYDAGAVAARKWKIWQPFEFDLFSLTNPAGTAIIPAAQQATT